MHDAAKTDDSLKHLGVAAAAAAAALPASGQEALRCQSSRSLHVSMQVLECLSYSTLGCDCDRDRDRDSSAGNQEVRRPRWNPLVGPSMILSSY
jgi:hypothetical protein